MKSRQEVIDFCLTLKGAYEDYPFHDFNWALMRHKDNKKTFAAIFERQDNIWINLKSSPEQTYIWRDLFESVVPAYHMNKLHWNSVILDGSIPDDEIKIMIEHSYELTCPKVRNEVRCK